MQYFQPTMEEQEWKSFEEFVTAFNKHRLAKPNCWIGYVGNVCSRRVKVKNFDTWLQILDIDGIRCGQSCETKTIKEWKAVLTKALQV